jgi:CRP/FNR family cyclic AMP-dependent transcriptional regulator
MPAKKNAAFSPRSFLSTIGNGRTLEFFPKKTSVFVQGEATDGLFFIQSGKVRLNVVSEGGKEATLGILSEGDFFGEGGLAGQLQRMSSATAVTDCVVLHIHRTAMARALTAEPKLSALFLKYLLRRNIRYQDDLVDQLFNSSEKRLARVLLLMAQFGKKGVSEMSIPRLSQETLAEMVGTTRSRISFFMNRFRKLGFINYSASEHVRVDSSLLNIILHDEDGATALPGHGNHHFQNPEPPADRGKPSEKDRAKRPLLPGFSR